MQLLIGRVATVCNSRTNVWLQLDASEIASLLNGGCFPFAQNLLFRCSSG